MAHYNFMTAELPDDAYILDVLVHLRGLHCCHLCNWTPENESFEKHRESFEEDDRVLVFDKYYAILMQFKDRLGATKGYQRAVRVALNYMPHLKQETRDRFQHNLKKLTRQFVVKKRWAIVKLMTWMLVVHKGAVITANHPTRKRARHEFEIEE
jgi:hypothetical protein